MKTEAQADLVFDVENNLRDAGEDHLLAAANSGNGNAFAELSGRHSKSIQLKLYRILGNWEDAEDVLQESQLKAFKHLAQFRGNSGFSTWLTRIAINSALMLLRRRKVRPETSYDRKADSRDDWELWEFADTTLNPELHFAERETEELMRGAILRLPWCYRRAFQLHHSEDRSTIEIAQALGISVSAAKSRLYRARTTLRTTLPGLGLSI
jgi:RNA polymerase sigma-70 factor (ECF subfamily)